MQNEGESNESMDTVEAEETYIRKGTLLYLEETGQSTAALLSKPTGSASGNTAVVEEQSDDKSTKNKGDDDEDISITFSRIKPKLPPEPQAWQLSLNQSETNVLKTAETSKINFSDDAFNDIQAFIENDFTNSQGQIGNDITSATNASSPSKTSEPEAALKLPDPGLASTSTTIDCKGDSSASAPDSSETLLTADVEKDPLQNAITESETVMGTTDKTKTEENSESSTNNNATTTVSGLSELESANKNFCKSETAKNVDDDTEAEAPEGENVYEEDSYGLLGISKRKIGDNYHDMMEMPTKRTKNDNEDAEAFFKDEWECNFEDKVSVVPETTGVSTSDNLAEKNDDGTHSKCRAEKEFFCTEIELLHLKIDKLMQRQMLLDDFSMVQFPAKFRTFFHAREHLLNLGKRRSHSDPEFVLAPGSSFLISVLKNINERAYGSNAEMSREEIERIEATCRKNIRASRGRVAGGSRWCSDNRSLPDKFTYRRNNTTPASAVTTNNTSTYKGAAFQNPFYSQQQQTTETFNNSSNGFYTPSHASTVASASHLQSTQSTPSVEVDFQTAGATDVTAMSDAGSESANILGTGIGRNKKMECEVCGKIMSKNTLKKHLNLHIGIIFQCPVCKVERTFLRHAQKCLKDHDSKEYENVQVYLICDDGTRRLVQREEEDGIRENFLKEMRRCKQKMAGSGGLALNSLSNEPAGDGSHDHDEELIRQLGIQREQMMHEQSVQRQNTSQQDSLLDQQIIQQESYMRQQELLLKKSIMGDGESENTEDEHQNLQNIQDQSIHQQELIHQNIRDQQLTHQQRSVQLNELLNSQNETQGADKPKKLSPMERSDALEYLAQTMVPVRTSALISNLHKTNSNISNRQKEVSSYGYFTAPIGPPPPPPPPKVNDYATPEYTQKQDYTTTHYNYETGGNTFNTPTINKKKNRRGGKRNKAKVNTQGSIGSISTIGSSSAGIIPPIHSSFVTPQQNRILETVVQDYGVGEPVGVSSVPPVPNQGYQSQGQGFQSSQQTETPVYGKLAQQLFAQGITTPPVTTGGQAYTQVQGQVGQIRGYIRQAQTSYFTTQQGQGSSYGREEYGQVLRAGSGQHQPTTQTPGSTQYQSSTTSTSSYGEFKSYAEYAKTFLQTRPYMR